MVRLRDSFQLDHAANISIQQLVRHEYVDSRAAIEQGGSKDIFRKIPPAAHPNQRVFCQDANY